MPHLDETTAIPLLDLHPDTDTLREEVLAGLNATPKALSPKFFYDAEGSKLFDRITELDAYYPTRTEVGILRANVEALANVIGEGASLVELGSGSSLKTHILLDRVAGDLAAYVPVDISREHLMASARRLAEEYPGLEILPVCADYTQPLRLPTPSAPVSQTVVFFPGSTIGNFEPSEAVALLQRVRRVVGEGGGMLVGVDLKKDRETLELAYDDPEGVTASFNLNLLTRLNRELGATFDLGAFRHRARYRDGVEPLGEETTARVETHLVSQRAQTVRVAGQAFAFEEGETIHTENSYKYTLGGFAVLAQRGGFRVETVWTDPDARFSVQYLVAMA